MNLGSTVFFSGTYFVEALYGFALYGFASIMLRLQLKTKVFLTLTQNEEEQCNKQLTDVHELETQKIIHTSLGVCLCSLTFANSFVITQQFLCLCAGLSAC